MGDFEKEGTIIMSSAPSGARPQGEACLILIHPPGADIGRKTVLSAEESYVIGRDENCGLTLASDAVSRRHAVLRQTSDGGWSVEDLGSTNGSFVNEERISVRPLVDGDQVRFGDAIFKFLSGENIESAYHEEIFQMTIKDGLTGVHNKRYLLDFLERELASAHRHGNPLSLVLFDIDHFKMINDSRGHLCGDDVLKTMMGRVSPRMRREDLLARYGGEEFAAVLSCTPLAGAVQFAEQVRRMVADVPFRFNDEEFDVTVSLGVACVHQQDLVTSEGLIAAADEKLYEAKRDGRNRIKPTLSDDYDG